jgi:hypothetical protein
MKLKKLNVKFELMVEVNGYRRVLVRHQFHFAPSRKTLYKPQLSTSIFIGDDVCTLCSKIGPNLDLMGITNGLEPKYKDIVVSALPGEQRI